MSTTLKLYSTATSGTITVQDTKQDVQLVHDASVITTSLTVVVPPNPSDNQYFGISTTSGITSLTLSSSISIVGIITSLIATGYALWMYCSDANKWVRVG